MKIGLQTWGSDGDILPFMALASGLAEAGHEVTLAYTSVNNKDYTTIGDNQCYELIKVYDEFEVSAEIINKITRTRERLKQLSLIMKIYYDPAVEAMYEASKKLCSQCDIVIGHCFAHTLVTAALLFNKPRGVVTWGPFHIRSKYSSPFGLDLGRLRNKLFWYLIEKAIAKNLFQTANKIRSREGVLPIKSYLDEIYTSSELTIIATSEALVERKPDWGDHIQISGFLNKPIVTCDWTMPEDLRAFLDAGQPPVYMTFGSVTDFSLEKTTELLMEAARLSGQRAIIYSNWDALPNLADDNSDIYRIGYSPYDKILPHCSAIVHHGGIGTTQASLIAECPSVVVEHVQEQEYWGIVLNRLGIASKPLHRETVIAKEIANEINKIVQSPNAREKARAVADVMRKENGIAKAVELIERRFDNDKRLGKS